MENNNFYYKYLKYKNKYLKLSKKYKDQVGGNIISEEEIMKLVDLVNNSKLIKIYKQNVNKIRKHLIDNNKVYVYPTSLYILEFINNKLKIKYNKELEFFRKHNLKIMGSSYRWIYIFEDPDITLKQFYWTYKQGKFEDSSDYKEFEFMKKINYPFSSKLLYNDIIDKNDDEFKVYYIVMNTIKGVDLVDIKQKIQSFNLQHFKEFLLQMCMINYYLHINGIVHLDLKLDNYILDDENFLNVIDFGSTKCLNKKCDPNNKLEEPRNFYERIGTVGYRLPKQLNFLKQKYSFEFDYYSTIISLLALLLNVDPANIESEAIKLYKDKGENAFNLIMIHISSEYKKLILRDYIKKSIANNRMNQNIVKKYRELENEIKKYNEIEDKEILRYNEIFRQIDDIKDDIGLGETSLNSVLKTKNRIEFKMKNNIESLEDANIRIGFLENRKKELKNNIDNLKKTKKNLNDELLKLSNNIMKTKDYISKLFNYQLEECTKIAYSENIDYIIQLNNIISYLFGKEFESFSNNCQEIEKIGKKYCSYLCQKNCKGYTPHKYIVYILLDFFGNKTYDFDKLEDCFSFIDKINNKINLINENNKKNKIKLNDEKEKLKNELKMKIKSIYK